MANIKANMNKDGIIISYRIRVSDGCSVDGRQRFQTMTWKVPRGMTEKQAAKEAEKVAIQFEDEVKNGLAGSQRSLKLVEFVPMYLDIKRDILSPRTFEYYSNIIDKVIIPLLGHMKISEIRSAHIQQFVRYLQRENPGTSPATIKKKLAILQSMLTQAVKLDIIPMNPADAKRLTLPKMVTPKVEIFSKQEAAEMLECLEQEELQYQCLVLLAIMTGCRLGELIALKFSDIDYNTNKVTIERSAYKCKGKPIALKPPKDYEVRTITITDDCIELIKLLKAEKERERMRLGTAWIGDEWLFTQWNGKIMNPQTPTKWFGKFLEKNGLKHRKFHSLRHTSATLLLYGGVNLQQVRTRLGHADISTTNKYLHCLAEADTEAASVLGSMLISRHKHSEEQADNTQKTG